MEARPAHRRALCAALALALTVVGGACGDNSDDETTGTGAGASSTVAPTSTAGGKALAVTGVDYAFTGVPKTVPAGTVVTFSNTSTKEVHELVALRVKDGDTRPVSALLQLPEAERDQAAEFKGVSIALPGEPAVTPEGPVTLAQPGRYLFVCTIPTGADPAAYKAAMQNPTSGPPPSIPGGPPHVVQGMVSELTVT
jgi:uncharacterized cupredoxin-like copper-binding protein